MNLPHVTVHPGQRADRHARLRASLEQKTLAILSAEPGAVEQSARNVCLYAETLGDIGAIDGDERRDYAQRAMQYAGERTEQLIIKDGEEVLTIIGIFFSLVALAVMVVAPCYVLLVKSIVPWQRNLDMLAELKSPLKAFGWLALIAIICIPLGSGFRSAISMAARWKCSIGLAFILTCAIMIFGLSWHSIQYYV